MSKNDNDYLSEAINDFQEMRMHSKKIRKQERDDRTKSIYNHLVDFKEAGIDSYKLTDYQYRFIKEGHRIDYYPTSGKYFDITLNKWGKIPANKIISLFEQV